MYNFGFVSQAGSGRGNDHCYDDMIDIKYDEPEFTLYKLFKAHFARVSVNSSQLAYCITQHVM